jgi:hypothetical protein
VFIKRCYIWRSPQELVAIHSFFYYFLLFILRSWALFYFFFFFFFSPGIEIGQAHFFLFGIMDGMLNGTATAAAVVAKPTCGSGQDSNPDDYDLPLHIAAVCKQ